MTKEKANGSNQSTSNDVFRNIVEAAPMGIHFYQLEPEGRLVFCGANRAADRFLGVNTGPSVGKTIEEAFPALAGTEIPEAYRRVAQTGEPWQTEQVVYHEGQIAGAFEVHAFQTMPGHLAISFLNITGQKRTEETLQRLRLGVEQSLDGLAIADLNGLIQFVNPSWAAMHGYQVQELVGQPLAVFHTEEQLRAEVEPFNARVMVKGVHQGEMGHVRRDGSTFPTLMTVTQIKDAAGQPMGLLATCQDITERKQAEQLLARRANELQAVTELSAVISSILDTDLLLQEVVDLTKNRFDLYHAHIYVLDETGENLVLVAGAGDVGRKMAAEGWHIPLAQEQSLVARAARSRQAVVANDVRSEPHYLPNPALPDTRSEMALPLIAGEALLGVLDVQSNLVNRFTDEDIRLKTTLAAQAAVALQNARLFADQERMSRILNERVKELNCLNEIGRAIAEAPEPDELLEWVTERIPPAMRYPEECVAAIEYGERVYGVAETLALPCQMAHALRIGGEVLGRVYIAYRQKRDFLNEESALLGGIAGRLSGYLESRRLLAQVQAALNEVEQSQEFLRTVIDVIPVPVFIVDVNDVYLGCNKAYREHFNRTEKEIVGKSIYEVYDKELADRYHEADQQLYNNPGSYQFETTMPREDGSMATVIYSRATFNRPDGSVAGQVATILDITERKAAEEALLKNEAQLSEALQLARLAYWELDVESQMFTFNDQLYALFGTTAGEQGGYRMSAGDFARKFVHPDEAATVGRHIQQALETTDPDYTARFESRTFRADGREGYIAVQLKVAKDEQGQTLKLYGTNQDVTERKLAELERERLLAEVEATYRQYVRQEWAQFLGQHEGGRWRVEHQAPGVGRQDSDHGDTTVVPIDLRGQPIGAISLQNSAPNRHWTEDDQTLVEAVSEQLALTIENLRLFSATQQQAVREQLARQITDKMRSAADVDSIIQTGLNELAKALGVARAYVRLSPKQPKPAGEAGAETPNIEAIRSQLKHNGHKPPAASLKSPGQQLETKDAGPVD